MRRERILSACLMKVIYQILTPTNWALRARHLTNPKALGAEGRCPLVSSLGPGCVPHMLIHRQTWMGSNARQYRSRAGISTFTQEALRDGVYCPKLWHWTNEMSVVLCKVWKLLVNASLSEVTAVGEAPAGNPGLVNKSGYDDGRLIRMTWSHPSELDDYWGKKHMRNT